MRLKQVGSNQYRLEDLNSAEDEVARKRGYKTQTFDFKSGNDAMDSIQEQVEKNLKGVE